MNPRVIFITAVAAVALAVGTPTAWGERWAADRPEQAAVAVSPDVVDRAVVARQRELTNLLDARERALGARRNAQLGASTHPDAFERAVSAAQTRAAASYSGVFERTVRAGSASYQPSPPPEVPTRFDWSDAGIGAGAALALALLLVGAIAVARRTREGHPTGA